MQNKIFLISFTTGFVEKIRMRLHAFKLRLIVHFCAFFIAAVASVSFPRGQTGLVVVSTYIGLVCLFSREMSLKASWLIPFGSGLVQSAVLMISGSPFHYAVFFGGLQTWLQRIIIKQGNNGTEWLALLFLAVVALYLTSAYGFPYITFPVILIAAICVNVKYQIDFFSGAFKKKLSKSLKELEYASVAEATPLQFRRLAEKIVGLGKQYEKSLSWRKALKNSTKETSLIESITRATRHLDELALMEDTSKAFRNSYKRTQISLDQALVELERFIGITIEDTPDNQQKEEEKATFIKMLPFQESAEQLLQKKQLMPEAMHGHIDAIHKSAISITDCICTDPKDLTPGTRFLERYLPATHRVVDEYLRLSKEGIHSPELLHALNLSHELLVRLENAFASEHAALLQNDAINFTSELKVLDSLLKMEGR